MRQVSHVIAGLIERGELKAVRIIRKLNSLTNHGESTLSFDKLYKFYRIHGLEFSDRFYTDYYDVAHDAEDNILQQAACWQFFNRFVMIINSLGERLSTEWTDFN